MSSVSRKEISAVKHRPDGAQRFPRPQLRIKKSRKSLLINQMKQLMKSSLEYIYVTENKLKTNRLMMHFKYI